jgi:hypothetical protein
MNGDGTAGVDAAVNLGARTPPLLVPGLALVAIGIMIGIGGFALVAPGSRPAGSTPEPVPAIA